MLSGQWYTVAGKAIGFAPEQPLHVVALACPASGILKQLEYKCEWQMFFRPDAEQNYFRSASVDFGRKKREAYY
ncbi:MAG: hypothetical protein LBJ00_06610 [Planctomycetaceae bacterium]|nr:hypothetical protein [Planctomycetaceae bacterium]